MQGQVPVCRSLAATGCMVCSARQTRVICTVIRSSSLTRNPDSQDVLMAVSPSSVGKACYAGRPVSSRCLPDTSGQRGDAPAPAQGPGNTIPSDTGHLRAWTDNGQICCGTRTGRPASSGACHSVLIVTADNNRQGCPASRESPACLYVSAAEQQIHHTGRSCGGG